MSILRPTVLLLIPLCWIASAALPQDIVRLDPGSAEVIDLPTMPGVASAPLLGDMKADGLLLPKR